jgi:ABC-type phosphate transport system permease subunit
MSSPTADAGRDRYDITRRSNRLARRRVTEKAFAALGVASALLAVGLLALVLGSVVAKGLSQLSLSFFTEPRPLFGEAGGIVDALVGSALIVGMCMAMAIPFAVLVAIYMSEYAGPRMSRALRIVLDVLNGVPAIVVGIFVFGLLVAVSAYRSRHLPNPARGLGVLIGLAVVIQLGLGIATLMSGVPVWLGVLHQLGAVAVLTAAVAFAWRVRRV